MIKSLKSNKIIAAILIAVLVASILLAGVTLLAPKTTEVKAAGTSTTLSFDWSSNERLGSTGVSLSNIVNLTITTTASKIQGFTKGNDVSHAQDGSLHYYYKLSGTQVDTNNDGVLDDNGYDVVIYANVDTIYAPESSNLFDHIDNCKTITFDNFNTSNVTVMRSMFYDCTALTSLDLSGFNTSNVTDMSWMFASCSSLTSLDLSNFDTSNVTSMFCMFYGCTSLTSLNVSSFNTSNVTKMYAMFEDCTSLTSLDVSSFNTSNVTDMGYMFAGCSSLTSLDLNSFDTSKVTLMYDMFYNCSSLTSLDVSGFDTTNVTDMNSMFGLCTNLTYINTSHFNTSKVETFFGMFAGCEKMEVLDLTSFTFNSITSAQGVLGMIGINDTLVLGTLQAYGATELLTMYQQAILSEDLNAKIQIVAVALENLFSMNAEDALQASQSLFAANIHTVYAPAQDVSALNIALPYNNGATYVYNNGSGEQITQFLVGRGGLSQMAIYPQGDTPNEIPLEPVTPDTSNNGVSLIILITLTIVVIVFGLVLIIINKKRKIKKRIKSVEQSKKLINKD